MYNEYMAITREEVDHIAELAKLLLTDVEKARFQEQLSDILDYAQRLQALDTEAIPPTPTVLPLRSVMRDDVVAPGTPTAVLLSNAPKTSGDSFEVQAVLE
jgi:aspartyl-tRNA(Asn)/glutamyl-tRNA(Gln) amidotransferase subunit C